MNPSIETFSETKYKVLMDGLECSEIWFSKINLGDRMDSDYYTKEFIHIAQQMGKVDTLKLGNICTTVASAFYPAATQLYEIGDMPFVRCVDCISFPFITNDQDDRFEKIPYSFGKDNKGIAFIRKDDIVITKVGSPCYASIVDDYAEIALSRTVLGLTSIQSVDPFYLMIFLRCKYGFEQLYRQRELTIQYQLTLSRVKNIDIYIPSEAFQRIIRSICINAKNDQQEANRLHRDAERTLIDSIGVQMCENALNYTIKSYKHDCLEAQRMDAEYFQLKYDDYYAAIAGYPEGFSTIRQEFSVVNQKCDRSENNYRYIEIGDIDVSSGTAGFSLIATTDLPDNAKIMTKKNDILVSTVRPNRGAVAILDDDGFLVSGAFTVLREKGQVKKEVLQILLRTALYRDWLLRYNVGTSYPVIKNEDVLNMPIPLLKGAVQDFILNKAQTFRALRQKSRELLEYAKQAVEMAIEHGEVEAIKWLETKGVDY